MDSDDPTEPRTTDSQAETRRWLGRMVLVALGLWFIVSGLRETWPAAGVAAIALYLIADGLIGIWPDAGPTARVVIVVAVVLGLVAAGVGALYVVRPGVSLRAHGASRKCERRRGDRPRRRRLHRAVKVWS